MEKYSFSKIKCFKSCPYGFYLKYFERPELKDPTLAVSHGTSEFGSFCHEILEKYEKNELALDELSKYYEEHFQENIVSTFEVKMSEDFSKDLYWNYYNDGKNYFENFTGFCQFKVLEAEYDFSIPIGNKFLFLGKVDLVVEDRDGNFIIIDHKSKSKFKNKAEQKEYAIQLYLYAYAIRKKYHKFPDKLMFNMFRKGEWVEIKFNINDYVSALKWLINNVEEIESTFEFPAEKDTFYCWNFCDYRLDNFKECMI